MMKLRFQGRIDTIVAPCRPPARALLLLRLSGARHLDFSQQICDTLRPISRAAAGELPPTHDVGGMTRNPMRRTGPYLTALSVANARSFNRLSMRLVMCATIPGSMSQTRPEPGLRQTA
jgi:hypothetical protein